LTLPRALGIIGFASRGGLSLPARERSRFSVLAFIIRRILQSVAVMAVVAFIAFGLFNFTGDPVTFMVGQDATQEERARLRADLGLDLPFYVQFGRFVGRAAQGDFGLSLRQGRKVSASRCRRS
jgi:peptide/nickel transport system permease protein